MNEPNSVVLREAHAARLSPTYITRSGQIQTTEVGLNATPSGRYVVHLVHWASEGQKANGKLG